MLNSSTTFAQQKIKLYQGKAPGSENWQWTEGELKQNELATPIVYNVVEPELYIYLPYKEKANGTSIIIAPGGAFHILSMDSEGHDVAKWLNCSIRYQIQISKNHGKRSCQRIDAIDGRF
ncbi:MAG: hypothetical protein ACO29O_02805 [Chitinophagaceae bacterium]